jgi:hypothetical protein
MVVNRNATCPRPLTRAERSTAVTLPRTTVPVGKAWMPSTVTGARSVPRTGSSTLLESDATDVVSSTGSTVPAGSVTSRYSGARGAGSDLTASVFAAAVPVEPTSRGAVAAPDVTDPPAVRNDAMSARRISALPPSRVSTTTYSGFTSTRRPDTFTPSFFSSVTWLPALTSKPVPLALEQPTTPPTTISALTINSFFIWLSPDILEEQPTYLYQTHPQGL